MIRNRVYEHVIERLRRSREHCRVFDIFVRKLNFVQERDSVWAEPKNKNPLEKTTLSREGITAQSKEMKDENAVCFSYLSISFVANCCWWPMLNP